MSVCALSTARSCACAARIDAATTSGRSARVKALAHLYFDEQEAGPAAGSTLAGPVCVTGSATVDTENSSTVLTVQKSCAGREPEPST
jgi:hypothetical protein